MRDSIDFSQFMAAAALATLGEPGTKYGSKWRYGTHGSLCVDIKAGTWFDHENNVGGGVVDFVMQYKAADKSGAFDFLAELRRINPTKQNSRANDAKPAATKRPFKIVKTWTYTDETGAELFEVCRLENGEIGEDGKPNKTYRQRQKTPDGYAYNVKNVRQVPYRLPELLEGIAQGKTVFITEGEKCVDAVFDLGAVATCNAGGARKFRDELVPFFKRADVVVLPDNDPAGQSHLAIVSGKLHGVASGVRVLNLPGLKKPKDDIVDWIGAGGTLEQLEALAANAPKAVAAEPELQTAEPAQDKAKPHAARGNGASQPGGFRMSSKGLMWSDASDKEKPEIMISGPFEVVAECRDDAGSNWGRLLRWRDSDGRTHEWAMPVYLLAGDGLEVRKALLDGGLYVGPGSKARNLLTTYLTSVHVSARSRAVTTTGWHGHAFVFPEGAIGIAAGDELQTPHFVDHAYNVRGSLEEWQDNIARYAEGNSRLTLAISTAFAAALVGPCDAESGGIHLRGRSSVGKTTALHIAGSVWGGGDRGFIRSWRATANGLEGTATTHSDTLLCLDEIAQLGAREAGEAAYMLANGQGKARASRDATLRKAARWRSLFLSTGEIGLADKIAEDLRGRRQTAGQQVRVIDLPSDTGIHGIFETLHDFTDAAALANHLRSASGKYYGTAARAFIENVAKDLDAAIAAIKARLAQFVAENCGEGADGQVKRVASRFGLIAAAGELAICLGILPWRPGNARDAANKCFQAWLDARGGNGAAEEKDGIAAVRAFLSAHGLSRFLPAWEASDFEPKIRNLAGYRKRADDEPGVWDFFPGLKSPPGSTRPRWPKLWSRTAI